jgi:hypothetical protein
MSCSPPWPGTPAAIIYTRNNPAPPVLLTPSAIPGNLSSHIRWPRPGNNCRNCTCTAGRLKSAAPSPSCISTCNIHTAVAMPLLPRTYPCRPLQLHTIRLQSSACRPPLRDLYPVPQPLHRPLPSFSLPGGPGWGGGVRASRARVIFLTVPISSAAVTLRYCPPGARLRFALTGPGYMHLYIASYIFYAALVAPAGGPWLGR